MKKYGYTVDMGFKRTITNLSFILKEYGAPNNIIEIGCFEGVTAVWCADNITPFNKNLKIYAIDMFDNFNDYVNNLDDNGIHTRNELINYSLVKETCKKNIDICEYKVIELIENMSDIALIDLYNKKIRAELIYVDGDHSSAGVLSDMILSWKLLNVGGVMLIDDAVGWKFITKEGCAPVQHSPRMGMESFVNCFWHKLEIIHIPDAFQIAFKKIKE